MDFGFRLALRQPDLLFMRGVGAAPYCYVVQHGPQARFVGLGLSVASLDDLNKLAACPDASPVEDVDWPGGGKRVRMIDPAGFRVDAIWGQSSVEPLPHRAAIKLNEPDNFVRIDSTQRPPQSPPEIIKLGHVLLEAANFEEVCAFYTGRFGFIPSDVAVLPDGEPAATFFRLDLGDTPADHHTLALTINFTAGYGHSAYEVVDADAVGMGQRVLQKKGWRHAWGIGRHILGSQIFDYWERSLGRQARALLRWRRLHQQAATGRACGEPGGDGPVGADHAEKFHQAGFQPEEPGGAGAQSARLRRSVGQEAAGPVEARRLADGAIVPFHLTQSQFIQEPVMALNVVRF